MKPRRHVLGGLVLIVVAVLLVLGEWTVLGPVVLLPLAGGLFVAGLANVALGIGRPAVVRVRMDAVEAGTALLFALLSAAIATENALAPDGPSSSLLAVLWGAAAVFTGWYGARRFRSDGGRDGPET